MLILAAGCVSNLFSDTAAGAKASAVIYSLVLTCRAREADGADLQRSRAGRAEGEATEDVEAAAVADTGLPDAEKPEPKKRGRKPLPKDLPRERVEHDLAEDQKACPCCRNRMHRMGETMSEQLHIEVKA